MPASINKEEKYQPRERSKSPRGTMSAGNQMSVSSSPIKETQSESGIPKPVFRNDIPLIDLTQPEPAKKVVNLDDRPIQNKAQTFEELLQRELE